MLFALFLIFVIVPIIEISILIQVGEQLGVMTTIALVILTAAVGASLVRSQGLQTLMSAQQKIQQGQQPGQEVIEGVMLAIAGVLLVTPGFVTDIFGLLVLTPVTRKLFANYLLSKMIVKGMSGGGFHGQSPFQGGFGHPPQQDGDIIDGEYSNKDHEHHLGNSDRQESKDDEQSTKH
ncbi:FxsA family protein [Psychrobium sp. 1_MG-2023]|uniref:FxsA family protein n=1 Tax=Psychrobium sp. 1_MG-2023 TaxID=3062624 RepID=UPI000C3465BA|nr:FxsA family protein [Psychrobium sp. 1_MG-2023]MDP2559573.1 FxsA family protein [Psychrobium sp. 1_MG-2023]PKF59412.1 membrane protein FxsA [Alteromonadales bacterium alter-6D02]